MILGIGLGELGIGSISDCHYNNSRCCPLDIFTRKMLGNGGCIGGCKKFTKPF